MLPFYRKYWRTAFDIALIALTVWLIMFVFSYLYQIATPVFMSFLIFLCIEPLAKRMNKIGIPKSIASALSILIFSLVIIAGFTAAGILLVSEVNGLMVMLPEYQDMFVHEFNYLMNWVQAQTGALPEDTQLKLQDFVDQATEWAQKLATTLLVALGGFLSSFSTFIFNFVIGIILAYFLSVEIVDWKKLASEKTPKTFKTAYFFLKNNVLAAIGGYVKAQLILISITFVVILASLIALGVSNAFMIAALSAIADILPLLGVSTVFIPWIIYLFIVGETTLAIWLCALLGVVILTRQFLEPKITGDTLGVSAYTMLVAMIVSLSLFGVAGVILSPIIVILIKALLDQGYLQRWIHAPKDEFEVKPVDPPTDEPPDQNDMKGGGGPVTLS